jgi:hypothetical protein
MDKYLFSWFGFSGIALPCLISNAKIGEEGTRQVYKSQLYLGFFISLLLSGKNISYHIPL